MLLAIEPVWDKRCGLEDLYELSIRLGNDYCIAVSGLDQYQEDSISGTNIIPLRTPASDKDLCALLTQSDVFITMSHAEASVEQLLKAMACGTPVVCYDTCALPEVITENTGCVVPYGDVDAFT